ncbi:FecR domain-containing protein [Pseudoxanthomonas dokdonensis]|uniref:LysM domain-containing protein n=1 Tax=Pseudoxanthomonas dokdonensis TaxID=344882 RepID=A0A0R0CHX0_9GAMM|nr:FecR domain-containing protein [Pseudoxanthomonas dokdonensis]KRG69072.1 hypothetical protein ABB29_11625 [Pseudoxanthomonas dokdonensis]
MRTKHRPGHTPRSGLLLLPLLVLFWLSPPASAEDWVYRVKPGDTLWDLAGEYLKPGIRWQRLQRHNHIGNPRQLPPGTSLHFPLQWLQQEPAVASVTAVAGTATYRPADGQPAQPVIEGMQLQVGAMLQTAAQGSLSLKFADGSRMQLRSNSELHLDRMSRYGRKGMSDTRMRLQRGRINNDVAPQKGGNASFIVETPSATSSVRGTQFRIDAATGSTDTEVLHGSVMVEAAGPGTVLPEGMGASVALGQTTPPRAQQLLPAPDLSAIDKRYLAGETKLQWTPLEGATGYRLLLSTDPDFRTTQLDTTVVTAGIDLRDLPEGDYHLLLSGIKQSLEGREARAAFVVDATPKPPFVLSPQPGSAVYSPLALAWAQSDGASAYRYQIASDEDFSSIVLEADGIADTRVVLPDQLAPGSYYWRVAGLDEQGQRGPYGDPVGFRLRDGNATLDMNVNAAREVSFHWNAEKDAQGYEFQLSRYHDFRVIKEARQVDKPSVTLGKLAPGNWYVRARALDAGGGNGEFPPAQKIRVPWGFFSSAPWHP